MRRWTFLAASAAPDDDPTVRAQAVIRIRQLIGREVFPVRKRCRGPVYQITAVDCVQICGVVRSKIAMSAFSIEECDCSDA